MLVREVMNPRPVALDLASTFGQAAEALGRAEIGTLMIVRPPGLFVGVLSEGDLIRMALPGLDDVLAAGGTLAAAFAAFVARGRELAVRPIEPFVIGACLSVSPDDDAAQAATLLMEKQLRVLPVLEEGRLIGSISRADLCRMVVTPA